MSRIERPVVVRRSRSSSRMPACTVTSSEVVGSSAMSSAGSPLKAIAIITRWRIPPLSSWGYWSTRRRGSAMPTRERSSTDRARAAVRSRPWCASIASDIWVPTDRTGLRLERGSWNTIAIREPRISRSLPGGTRSRSAPSNRTDPWTCPPRSPSRPMIANAVRDLPDPDSPTSATASPAWIARSIPFTGITGPPRRSNATVIPATSSSGWATRPDVTASTLLAADARPR